MEQRYYSIYNAIHYDSEELGEFFAVKNLLNTENREIFEIERVLYSHGTIQSKDLNKYCFVPGDRAEIGIPNIICFIDFYLVDLDTLEITGKIKIYPESNIGLNNFLTLCETDYAHERGWIT